MLPGRESSFVFEDILSETDAFELDCADGKVVIRGNNEVSQAAGLGWYLKYTVKANVSWCGSNLVLPGVMPLPARYRQEIDQKYRVYMNYCTFNYSASWWDWERWEKEIDFMALQGINMPLALVGIEGVWYETLTGFGLTDQETRESLAGPAFLAWQWMANLEGFCGPLPFHWIELRVELGRKIIHRMLEYGMMPIQHGFTGCVPRILKEKYPNARIDLKSSWCGIEGPAQLDPSDGLFRILGAAYYNNLEGVFGLHGYYAADPFHEGAPPETSTRYLNSVGTAIHDLISSFDARGVWVMQSWSIEKDIVTAVPKDSVLVLDLNGKKYASTDGFWGYNFVTGNLHNFGGRTNLHGDLKLLAANRFHQLRQEIPNVCGAGLFMEGIAQNPAYYDLGFEMLIRNGPLQLGSWLVDYVERRYGLQSNNARRTWEILASTAYAEGTNDVENSSIIAARPAVDVKKSGPNAGFALPYDNKDLLHALRKLSRVPGKTEGYRFDLVDLCRQVLSNHGQILYKEVASSFRDNNLIRFRDRSSAFIDLLLDVDRLLGTREEFSLERWILEARRWGTTDEEKSFYEWNASCLITLWGPEDDTNIFDYSWREWSGLIGHYYVGRWRMFFEMLEERLVSGDGYDEGGLELIHGREKWRANEFYNRLADWEVQWVRKSKLFECHKEKESDVVSAILNKYKRSILETESVIRRRFDRT